MDQLVNLAIAARLLGVTRATLQEEIRAGHIATFEGQIDLAQLQQAYPALCINQDTLMDRVQHLKETAFGRRVSEVALSSEESLTKQVRRLTTDLDIERARARKYLKIIQELAEELAELQKHCNQEQRGVLGKLKSALLRKIEG